MKLGDVAKGDPMGGLKHTDDLVTTVRTFAQGPVGMGLLLAWYYCTFYSCVLVWPDWTIRESEQYWVVSMLASAGTCIALFVCMRRGRRIGGARSWGFAAAGCASMATVLIFASYMMEPVDRQLVFVGAALAGMSMPFLLLLWTNALKTYHEGIIEFSVPAAFLVALALYLPLVAMKNLVSVVVIAALPLVSVAIAARSFNRQKHETPSGERTGLLGTAVPACRDSRLNVKGFGCGFYRNAKGLWKTCALFVMLWFSFALFRSCVSPTYFTDRFDHYLLPFACAGILAVAFCCMTLRNARKIGLFTTYRWVLPFMCLGYAMMFFHDANLSRIAFTVSFVGLVGIQLCFMIVVCKFARARDIPAGQVLLPLFACIGIGAAGGSACGLWALESIAESGVLAYAPLLMVALMAAMMAWGVDADDLVAQPERAVSKDETANGTMFVFASSSAKIIDGVAVEQAGTFARRYGLSPREREILGYLLAGRSRPFIRDELVLSLNTVNTHVRNIYAKTDVHSQQELLTLARELHGATPRVEENRPLLRRTP